MSKKSEKGIQLSVGSPSSEELMQESFGSSPPPSNELGEKLGKLGETVAALQERTSKINNLENKQNDEEKKLSNLSAQISLAIKIALWVGGIFAAIATLFGYYLLNEKQRIEQNFEKLENTKVMELNCKNIELANCYPNKCYVRDLAAKQRECELRFPSAK